MVKILKFIPSILAAVVIYFLSTRPISAPSLWPHADLIVHFILYFTFSALICFAFSMSKIFFIEAVILSFIYGGIMEICQYFIPERTASVLDALFNLLGAISGAYTFTLLRRLKPAPRKPESR